MIRIQQLKQPKASSGDKLEKGKSIKFKGMTLINHNSFPVYIDWYVRKPWKKRSTPTKKAKANAASK